MVGIKSDKVVRTELSNQARTSAFEHELRVDESLAVGIEGVLDQPRHAAQGSADAFGGQGYFPRRCALASARVAPDRRGLRVEPFAKRRYVNATWVPLDKLVHLGQAGVLASFNGQYQCGETEPLVQAKQDRRLCYGSAQALGDRDHAFEVEAGLLDQIIGARMQGQLQTEAATVQVGRQRALTVHASAGATAAFLGRSAVVHRRRIDVERQPGAGQHAVLGTFARQQGLDRCRSEVEHLHGIGVQALAKRRSRGQQTDAQGVLEGRVPAKVLDGVKVALVLHHQSLVGVAEVAVADTGSNV